MSSLPPDPYNVLGVAKDAQTPEIRLAHRKLVLKCHPDKVQDPTLKAVKQDEFQKVQQAYELLSDDKERSRYDDQIKLAELRKQRANTSAPRASPKYAGEFEVRSPDARPPVYRSATASAKTHTYSRSWEEDDGYGPRIFEAEIRMRRSPSSYVDKPSKRESEKERELRDRDKERESDRRRRADDEARRADKIAKEARRDDKKKREKHIAKERKRETEDKRRPPRPYIESFDDDSPPPRSEKKKSFKMDEKWEQERSLPREESSMPSSPISLERSPYDRKADYATSYIYASKSKPGPPSLQRAKTTYAYVQPHAPTPPPAGKPSPFPTPDDDDVRRSSAKTRRGSSDTIRSSREKPYKKSNERLDEPIIVDAAPPTRPAGQFHRSASTTTTSPRPTSPPRRDLPRTNTMPVEPTYTRSMPMPGISRAQTFSGTSESMGPRGRTRSKLQSQIDEESESENDDYDRRARDRGHRSRREVSPAVSSRIPDQVRRYQVDGGGRTKLSYSRRMDPDVDAYGYPPHSGARVVEPRPSPGREGSYRTRFSKVKESPMYGAEDVKYSDAYPQQYRGEAFAAYA